MSGHSERIEPVQRKLQFVYWGAPCGCKKYADGTEYKCLSHRKSSGGIDS